MKLRSLLTTLVFATLALAVTVRNGNGFFLLLLLPLILSHFAYNLLRLWRHPDERKSRRLRLGIWTGVWLLAAGVQVFWAAGTKSGADLAAQGVAAYRARLGAYPASLAEAGLDERDLRETWQVRYSVRDGKPRLSYPSPVLWLTTYEYDFATQAWRMNAD